MHYSFQFCKSLYLSIWLISVIFKIQITIFHFHNNQSPNIYISILFLSQSVTFKDLSVWISYILKKVKYLQYANFCKLSPLLYYQAMSLRIIASNQNNGYSFHTCLVHNSTILLLRKNLVEKGYNFLWIQAEIG